jgi:hypothetical protein
LSRQWRRNDLNNIAQWRGSDHYLEPLTAIATKTPAGRHRASVSWILNGGNAAQTQVPIQEPFDRAVKDDDLDVLVGFERCDALV